MKIKGFHGTDKAVAEDLLHNKFSCKSNDEHWLGNGIYFFVDKSLAEWWTTKPSKKYGTKIDNRAILECDIEIDESRVLNLCSLEGYKKYADLFNHFFSNVFYENRPDELLDFKKIRALFFNHLFLCKKIDMVIAPFIEPEQPYLPHFDNENYFKEMHIMYTEIQICFHEKYQDVIKTKSLIEVVNNNEK